jgi:hypothetical protein
MTREEHLNSNISDVDAVPSAHKARRQAFWTCPAPLAGAGSLRSKLRTDLDFFMRVRVL